MSKLKILFFTSTTFGVRGTTATYRFVELLAEKFEVLVVAPDRPAEEKYVAHFNKDINIIKIANRSQSSSLLKIKQIFLSFQPDVAYLFNSPVSLDYLVSLHHLFPATKWIADFQTPLLQKGRIRRKIRRKSFFVQLYVDAVFTLSRHSVKTWIPFLVRKTEFIPLGVDRHKFRPMTRDMPVVHCRRYVFIGSLHPLRKLSLLVEAFCCAIKKYPDLRISLDIYGAGVAEEELAQLINDSGIGDRVQLCGLLEQDKLFQLLGGYDAGIAYVPYEKYNNSPSLKLIEYAAAGLHVLASDTAAHKQQMKDHGLDFQLFANDKSSFINALVESAESGVSSMQIARNLQKLESCEYHNIIEYLVAPRIQAIVGGR